MRLPTWIQPDRRPAADGRVAEVVGPDMVHIHARQLQVGQGWCATLAVTGYPAMVAPAWLETILSLPGRLDVAVHIDPIPAEDAAAQLRRQRARLESSRRLDAAKSRLGDPAIDAAADDAAGLAEAVARGAARLFHVGVYVSVHAATEQALVEACAQVRAAAAGQLLDLRPVTHRHLHGWISTLPLGVDAVRMRRTLDTAALAACFPLGSPDLPGPLPGQPAPGGVLYGINLRSGGLVLWDRWSCVNHNSVILAPSGTGKSYHTKLEVLHNLYQHVWVSVVDREDEYVPLADMVGGTVVRLGTPGVHLNPLDIPTDGRPDSLTRRALYLHTLVAVLTGHPLQPDEAAALDRAIIATYHRVGITADPGTWTKPAPLLADLAAVLDSQDHDVAGRRLAAALAPWVSGSFNTLFAGPTTIRPDGHLVVWSLRHLPTEMQTIGTLLALDTIWRQVDRPPTGDHRRRLIVVDEAWAMLKDATAGQWMFKMAKSARKRHAGLAVATQDIDDVLGSELGRAVISNSATQLLMRQSPQSIDQIADAFALTAGERDYLLSARRGEALLVAGSNRVAFEVVTDPGEHAAASGAAHPTPAAAVGAAIDDSDAF